MAKQISEKVFSWEEYLACALDDAGLDKANHSRIERRDNDCWAGGSFDDAVRMATGAGFADALPKVDALVSHINDTVAADLFQTTFASTWEVAGAEVDMGRFLAGEPECMIESLPIRVSRQGRAVRLIVPSGVAATVDPDLILRRGAAVMALADVLARAQHPLEVWVGHAAHDSRRTERITYMIEVQKANEPLDPGRLMYALAHPSMLRRLLFSVMEHEPLKVRDSIGIANNAGYGFGPYSVSDADMPDDSGTSIVLPELAGGHDWQEADSVAWIEEQLATIFEGV